ncbi:MAG: ABC transporter permease [bacterium]|nr:ABC transporter permease [bacterium]
MKANRLRTARRHIGAVLGAVVLLMYVATALLAPALTVHQPNAQNLMRNLEPPSREYPLGTDELGRDILSRIIWGSRISLLMMLAGVAFSGIIGVLLGLLGGLSGPRVESLVMRAMDVLMVFPPILLAIVLVTALGRGLPSLVVAIGIHGIPQFTRLTRAMVMSLRETAFVEAARAAGARPLEVAFGHVLPNCAGPLIVQGTLVSGTVVLTVSGLSFLGLGVQPPTAEWGTMISAARLHMYTYPHAVMYPGLALMLLVIALNALGDGLRDFLDPRFRR